MNADALDKEYIISNSVPALPLCGIYFLIKDNEIVYVGQSIHIPRRLKTHKRDQKSFDKVFFVECKRKELDCLERKYIRKFVPKLNKRLVSVPPPPKISNRKLKAAEQICCVHYPERDGGYFHNKLCRARMVMAEFWDREKNGDKSPCWDNETGGCPLAQYPNSEKKGN
jgi:hypothetical protein